MKYVFILLSALAGSGALYAQNVFFKSDHTFSKGHLEAFYSSIAIQNDLLLFNANDYKLYAYNKNTGAKKWQQQIDWKSDIAPFFLQNSIWANGVDEVLQLDTATGHKIKAVTISRFDTQPTIINGILYGTGIYDAGCLFAYDLAHDSVLWSRFIAHGIAQTPYYLPHHIVTNAEGNNWLEVAYDGQLLKAGCDSEETTFPSELSCVKKFLTRTHNGKEISGKLAAKIDANSYGVEQVFYTPEKTFILNREKLFVVGNKLKLELEKELDGLSTGLQVGYGDKIRILKADKQTVWLHLGDYVVHYNFAKKKALRTIDLQAWAPHQVLVDADKLWLVSSTDGRLYGLTID